MNRQATTKNQIMDYLQWSTKEYDDRIFTAYWNWCQLNGKYDSIIQQMLANRSINRWFLMEYTKLENHFLQIVEVVPNKTEPLRGHYKACTAVIMTIYPKPLINAIKRNIDYINENQSTNTTYYAN